MNKLLKNKKGSALVEYGLLIAGVALVSAAAVSIFGHKTNDLIATTASILPGAHADDNGPIVSAKLIETTRDPNNGNAIILDAGAAATAAPRLGNNLLGATFNQPGGATEANVLGSTLVIEANEPGRRRRVVVAPIRTRGWLTPVRGAMEPPEAAVILPEGARVLSSKNPLAAS